MRKKFFELPFISSLLIPLVVVFTGAAIVYGIVSFLTVERSYKDLVKELQTKSFGNRWVAAFELSKHLASSKIPPEEIPWLVENLTSTYNESTDGRTRTFVITALGTLKSPLTKSIFVKALSDSDPQVQFQALVALGNMPQDWDFDWELLFPFLSSADPGLKQVTVYTLAHHKFAEANVPIESLLNDENQTVRYAAATALIYFKNEKALPYLREIFLLKENKEGEGKFNGAQVESLKLNVVNAIGNSRWNILKEELNEEANEGKSLSVSMRAKEVLKLLNN